jgi:hypothetical protein
MNVLGYLNVAAVRLCVCKRVNCWYRKRALSLVPSARASGLSYQLYAENGISVPTKHLFAGSDRRVFQADRRRLTRPGAVAKRRNLPGPPRKWVGARSATDRVPAGDGTIPSARLTIRFRCDLELLALRADSLEVVILPCAFFLIAIGIH